MAQLMMRFPLPGRVAWIGVRTDREQPVVPVDTVKVVEGKGLDGDRFRGSSSSSRQVTLIQAEHLAVIGALLHTAPVDPALLRRNIAVEGINLLALNGRLIRLGSAVLEVTGHCHPCSKMESALGPGGYNAMRGHGGMTARVISGGVITIGDEVVYSGERSAERSAERSGG